MVNLIVILTQSKITWGEFQGQIVCIRLACGLSLGTVLVALVMWARLSVKVGGTVLWLWDLGCVRVEEGSLAPST